MIRSFTERVGAGLLSAYEWACATTAGKQRLLALVPMPFELDRLVRTIDDGLTALRFRASLVLARCPTVKAHSRPRQQEVAALIARG